jgi:hypothetical protein
MYFFVFSDCLQNSHGLLSLEILDVTERDMGQFTCKAINSEGEVTCSASLEVMGKQVLLYYIISAMDKLFFVIFFSICFYLLVSTKQNTGSLLYIKI